MAKFKGLKFLRAVLTYQGDLCQPWPYSGLPSGYAQTSIKNHPVLVHRWVCERAHGSAPFPRAVAAHSCGNRPCCNPRHIRWTTQQQNIADKVVHGTEQTGERHGCAKLTEPQVRWVRSLPTGYSQRSMARELDVTETTISRIILGRTWSHIT